jgi:hypothetical protein
MDRSKVVSHSFRVRHLRGGWRINGALNHDFFSYDPDDYSSYTIETGTGTEPFTVPGPEKNQWTYSLGFTTPTFQVFTASASVEWGDVPIFDEAAPGRSLQLTAAVDLRPTAGLRTTLQYARLAINRQRDATRFSTENIPRVKVEYQLNRAIFFRVIGQYAARYRSPLEDREGNAILVNGVADAGFTSNELRVDWLFSYRPIPGTLVYFGYGSTMQEPQQFEFNNLERTTDGFFAKCPTCSGSDRPNLQAERDRDPRSAASPSFLTYAAPARSILSARRSPRPPDVVGKCCPPRTEVAVKLARETAGPIQAWRWTGFSLGRPTEEDRRRERRDAWAEGTNAGVEDQLGSGGMAGSSL